MTSGDCSTLNYVQSLSKAVLTRSGNMLVTKKFHERKNERSLKGWEAIKETVPLQFIGRIRNSTAWKTTYVQRI